ncbi:MAG: insulinase family protein [Deltaproteobacteria bacterium]|nr:insulinase family protein [Deltaproteobacteria bacterium]
MRLFGFAVLFIGLMVTVAPPLYAFEAHRLDNGMEVFLEENHIVPLVTIRLTFRAGAIVETADINGLCHLYEHMLFKGNELYRTQESLKAAMKRMGVGSWNGGTSTEYVTYYVTVPSDKMQEALQFWAAAVTSPLLDVDELSKEQEVVHNEIAGKQAEPGYKLMLAKLKALYGEQYYRRQTGGELTVIDSASVAQLQYIKDNFYVPNNAALFVSGDIDPAAALDAARQFYGSWKTGPGFPVLRKHVPLSKNLWVAVDNSPSKDIVSVAFTFRGPDTGDDVQSTYGADIWGQAVNDPQGHFKNNMAAAVPELHGGTRYIGAGYFTQRDGGETSFSFKIRIPENGDLWEVINRLRSTLLQEIEKMQTDGYFAAGELAAAKVEIENHDVLSRETAAGYMNNLSFWWASTSTEYYTGYLERIKGVTLSDAQAFLRAYVYKKNFLTSVWIHPEDDAAHGIVKRVVELDVGDH